MDVFCFLEGRLSVSSTAQRPSSVLSLSEMEEMMLQLDPELAPEFIRVLSEKLKEVRVALQAAERVRTLRIGLEA